MATDVNVILRNALRKLEAERSRVDHQLAALKTALRGVGDSATPSRRPKMSAAQRAALSKRMKAFWAKKRAAGKTAQTKKVPNKKPASAARAQKGTTKTPAAVPAKATAGSQ